LKFGKSEHLDLIFSEDDECDFSKANMAFALSSTEMDEKGEVFHATVDRIPFKKPVEIIATVLEANGYVINLENILACLDHMSMGIKGRMNSQPSGDEPAQIKAYLPCLVFKMPTKGRQGMLLKKFYKEIEGYEAELAKAQGQFEEKKKSDKIQSKAELRDEIKSLRRENESLKQQLGILTKSLSQVEKSNLSAERQLESGNYLPGDIRIATVRGILAAERTVVLKTGRKTFHLPMASLSAIPNIGDSCLVHIRDGKAGLAFFYAKKGESFKKSLAQVLSVEGRSVKLRDEMRNTVVIEAANDQEEQIIFSLSRGDELILSTYQGNIVRFDRCIRADANNFKNKIQEDIALEQIGVAFAEAVQHYDELDEESSEVA